MKRDHLAESNQNLKIWKVLQIHFAKKKKREKPCSGESTKGVVEQLFDKEISMNSRHKFNQPLQQQPGIEMGLYQQKHCQFGP